MAKPLQEYQRKRDFAATPEPAGKSRKGRKAQALQFCIQKHDASHLHYDFRLELDGTLKSWAVPKGPSLDPSQRRLAVHVEDHPLDYASFEGHIPQGHYGAGDVIVWDRGIWEPEGDPQAAYEKGKLRFRLIGEKLSGTWNLLRTHLAGKKEQWLLIKSNDEQARTEREYSVVEALPDSVLSEQTLPHKTTGKPARSKAAARPRKAALPDQLSPQLATLVDAAPEGDWRYEVKFDGYRLLARIEGKDIRLFTRNGHDWSARMPRQIDALRRLKLESAWLDGEVVVAGDKGVADFQALQNAFDQDDDSALTYYLFDAPWLNGQDLREVPLQQRRDALREVLDAHPHDALRYSADFEAPVDSLLASACQLQLEGLIGKRAGSPYRERRSSDWIKLKCQQRQEFVIVGYTDPKGSREGFGALLLALHDDQDQLRYAGRVGTGFSSETLKQLHGQLKRLKARTPPLPAPPSGAAARGVHWLRPTLLAEVAYAQMTRSGIVRHAVFHGLRDDKPAQGIDHERPQSVPGSNDKAVTTRKSASSTMASEAANDTPSAKAGKGAKASPAADTGKAAKASPSANTGKAAKASAPANTGKATKASAPANSGKATKASAPANAGKATKASAPANAGKATKASAPADTGKAAKASAPANTGKATKASAPANTGKATKASAPANSGKATKASSSASTGKAAKASPFAKAAGNLPDDFHLTHPERIIDPSAGITKQQVAEYYAQVAPWIMPHLRHRPVALVRAPEGLGGELFFQKHAEHLNLPDLRTFSKTRAGQAAMTLDSPAALLGAVQMNTLELHTWNATDKAFDKPDRFVLDLDPDPALPWKAMVEAAQLTLTLLDTLGLKAFVKTSGGKGLHLVVPLTRRAGWDEVKAFTQAIVEHLAGLFPERLSAVAGPKNRVGRIFIDYLRNGLGATTVCAYSLRARDGMRVSVPIRRDELSTLKGADQWSIDTVLKRLARIEDPWAELATTRQSITRRMRRQLGIDA